MPTATARSISTSSCALMLDLESGMSFAEARNGFEEIDTDHSGAIEFDEFVAWWTSD